MLSIRIICAGRLKERHYIDACAEYLKRIAAYARCEVRELPERESLPLEGKEMQDCRQKGAFSVALCIEGKKRGSEALAGELSDLLSRGVSKLDIFIGSSNGLDPRLKESCDCRLSMSDMTFPHHLARVMALEQVYRVLSINQGGKYHK